MNVTKKHFILRQIVLLITFVSIILGNIIFLNQRTFGTYSAELQDNQWRREWTESYEFYKNTCTQKSEYIPIGLFSGPENVVKFRNYFYYIIDDELVFHINNGDTEFRLKRESIFVISSDTEAYTSNKAIALQVFFSIATIGLLVGLIINPIITNKKEQKFLSEATIVSKTEL